MRFAVARLARLLLSWLPVLLLACTPSAEDVNTRLLRTMRSYMDDTQPPCERFYDYACGNWEQVQLQANASSYLDVVGSLENNANSELAALIEQSVPATQRNWSALLAKVRVYYETCRQRGALATQQLERYLELLKPAENVDWPSLQLESSNFTCFRWAHTLGRLRAIGLNNVLVQTKLKHRNATSYIFEISPPSSMHWPEPEEQQQLAEDEQLAQLQHKLQQLWQSSSNHSVIALTLGELQRRLPAFNVMDYMAQLYGTALPPELPMLVRGLSYLRKLSELLGKTSAQTLLIYLQLRLLDYLRREQPLSNSAAHCVRHQRSLMSLALDYIYEHERYRSVRNETDSVIKAVFKRMQQKFGQFIEQHLSELTPAELHFLQEKIQRMQLNIGNLPQGVGESYYTDYYATLEVAANYFHWNHLNALQHRVAREMQLLLLPSAAPEHTFSAWCYGSPAYHQPTNRVLIPYAYLQQPIFHRQFHELFLYAELGNTLGHEIMHGFDPIGLQYDANGSPSLLFMNVAHKKPQFVNAMACLSREPSLNLNEKLADFGGFRLAFAAHFERSEQSVPQYHDGAAEASGLSNKQLFFIKFAQFFCAISPQHIDYDSSHDTPFKRVPQVLANHAAFASEFKCGKNTRMYIKSGQRCTLW